MSERLALVPWVVRMEGGVQPRWFVEAHAASQDEAYRLKDAIADLTARLQAVEAERDDARAKLDHFIDYFGGDIPDMTQLEADLAASKEREERLHWRAKEYLALMSMTRSDDERHLRMKLIQRGVSITDAEEALRAALADGGVDGRPANRTGP